MLELTGVADGRMCSERSWMNVYTTRPSWTFGILALALAAGAGCGGLRPTKTADEAPAPVVYIFLPVGRVAHVNMDDGYVIIESSEILQKGTPAEVYAKGKRIGHLTIDAGRGKFYAADIQDGDICRGDTVKVRRRFINDQKFNLPDGRINSTSHR